MQTCRLAIGLTARLSLVQTIALKRILAKAIRTVPEWPRESVFPTALANTGYSLWLEHVTDKLYGQGTYWLMWYDPHGNPTIPLSGVLNAPDIQEMTRQLASFLQVP